MNRVVSHARNRAIQNDAKSFSLPALYAVKLAMNTQEFRAALRLRYEVFNVELREGLQSSHSTGHDFDQFDAVVDHIIVSCAYTNRVVGTYRLQTGEMAARNLGYYGGNLISRRTKRCARRCWNWGARASIRTIATRRYSCCCGRRL